MPRVSGSIPSFINGVSHQAPALRLPTQVEDQENTYSTIVNGLRKRPPTELLARLIPQLVSSSGGFHIIDRDENEKYVAVFDGGALQVFDFDGSPRTVSSPQGFGYLFCPDPSTQLRFLTVADYTFIVNTSVVARMRPDVHPARPFEAIINISAGNYGRTYSIRVNGTQVATFTTPNGDNANQAPAVSTTYIAQTLTAQLRTALGNDGAPWGVGLHANAIHIINYEEDFSIGGEDGSNGNDMKVSKDSTQHFSSLPSFGPEGFEIEVTSSNGTDQDNYWVASHKTGTEPTAPVQWKETLAPNTTLGFDAATMPHILVRNADGTFTFKQAVWDDRKCGDGDTIAPDPSFIGNTIQDVFFYRNRLGFLADESAILSRSASFFNFFRTTATTLLDDDPIDVAANHIKVSFLKAAIPYQGELLLFSTQTQFRMSGNDLFTPKTVSIKPLAEYASSSLCRPTAVGGVTYFATNPGLPGSYAAIYELTYEKRTETLQSAETTAHVPDYIPNGVYQIAGSVDESVLAVLTRGDPSAIYVYRYYYSGEDKVQASWSRWSFGNSEIVAATFIKSELYLLIKRNNGLMLEKLRMDTAAAEEGLTFQVALDCRTETAILDYDVDNDRSRFFVKGYQEGPNLAVILSGRRKFQDYPVTEFSPTPGGFIASIPGRHTGELVIMGAPYRSATELTQTFYRQQAGNQSVVRQDGRLQVGDYTFTFDNSAHFQVIVETEGRDPIVYEYSAATVGSPRSVIGSFPTKGGSFVVPIESENSKATITLVNETWKPGNILSASWRGAWNPSTRNG